MNQEYENKLVNIENDIQDKNTLAWKKLCEYVEKVVNEGLEKISLFEYLKTRK